MLDKMIAGKMRGFYEDNVLFDQNYMLEDGITVKIIN
jgi:translation elongation factor EF-Ts